MKKSSYEKIDCCFETPLCKTTLNAFNNFFQKCVPVCVIFLESDALESDFVHEAFEQMKS